MPDYEITDLGEFRMGAEGHGIVLIIDGERHEMLSDRIVFCNFTKDSAGEHILYSTDKRYLIIKGIFDTYVIDIAAKSIALFRVTVRDSNIWSEETAVLGSTRTHLNGEDGEHYFVQFPFVEFRDFNRIRQEYEFTRIAQLREQTTRG